MLPYRHRLEGGKISGMNCISRSSSSLSTSMSFLPLLGMWSHKALDLGRFPVIECVSITQKVNGVVLVL